MAVVSISTAGFSGHRERATLLAALSISAGQLTLVASIFSDSKKITLGTSALLWCVIHGFTVNHSIFVCYGTKIVFFLILLSLDKLLHCPLNLILINNAVTVR